jgi:hypothetical protein
MSQTKSRKFRYDSSSSVPRSVQHMQYRKEVRQEILAIAERYYDEGFTKRWIKRKLSKRYTYDDIRWVVDRMETVHPVDRCASWMQQEFNGLMVLTSRVIAAGERNGFPWATVHRAARKIAQLKKGRKKGGNMWKFDWITERPMIERFNMEQAEFDTEHSSN